MLDTEVLHSLALQNQEILDVVRDIQADRLEVKKLTLIGAIVIVIWGVYLAYNLG